MVSPKVIGIIQARMGSTRLPGKILAPIVDDLPLLVTLVKRISSPEIEWWIATTEEKQDNITEFWAGQLGMKIFRGSSEDVLSRFISISRIANPDWIIRVTADNPFMDRSITSKLITMIPNLEDDINLVCDIPGDKKFPLGYVPELIRATALEEASERISKAEPYHRQHVTSYLLAGKIKQVEYEYAPIRPKWRWTVDTVTDLIMMQKAFQLTGPNWQEIYYSKLVELFDANPDIMKINESVRQKAINEG